ncbi:hypothetical protein TRIUR3_10190 [Triticum urartu]|uniref:Arabinogalactan peptide 16 n=2 Tax=Triticum TaxID=4564 RepID=M7ZLR4_TRIUA|nr:hypothetical protein TRIUR3_10190 [Triticum urartu]
MARAANVDAPAAGAAQGGARKAEGLAAVAGDGRRVDQAVAYLLMAAALAVTYLVH